MGTQLLSPEQVMTVLGVSRPTVYRLFARRVFPVVHVGRLRRVREADLSAYIERETRREVEAIRA